MRRNDTIPDKYPVKGKAVLEAVKTWANLLAVPVLLLIIWQVLAGAGLLMEVILPSPVKIVKAFFQIIEDGTLAIDLAVSLRRVLIGYLLGAGTALILGIGSGLFKVIERIFSPLVDIIRQIPLYAWIPLIILWFGIGETSKHIIIAKAVFVPIYLNTVRGIHDVPNEYVELSKVLELTKKDFIFKIVLPSATPSIFTGLRLAAGNSWMAVVAAEMLGGLTGLGYGLLQAKEFLMSDKLIALMFVIAGIGMILDFFLRLLEKTALRWRVNNQGSKL